MFPVAVETLALASQANKHVRNRRAGSAGAEPAEGDVVSGGAEPPAGLGADREAAPPGSPAEQPAPPRGPDRRSAAQGGLRPAAPRRAPGEETLRGPL